MTYRELLKLYQEGKLDKAQTDEVEHAIEKQEAISEYLYEKEEIPGLEVLQGQEKEEVFVQGNDAESEEEQRFVKMIQKTIRDRKSTRLNSSHLEQSRMPSSA